MKLPNREHAQISSDKLTEYIPNTEHERGGTKARLLVRVGYTKDNWERLENDIRSYHLDVEIDVIRQTLYGVRYEIRAPLQTPSGRSLMVRTIWQVDIGQQVPRLVTRIPD